jgi:hypothetical protein
MSHQDQAAATDRLRRALMAFKHAQGLLLGAHRKLKSLSPVDVEAFWAGEGRHIEATVRATALELSAAFEAFSSAGLVADAADRHLVREAQRHLAVRAA